MATDAALHDGEARPRFAGADYATAAAAALGALAVYALTLAPTVTGEDSGELIAAAYTLGIPHPTGYPLWCLLGRLFITVLPFGGVAWRVNFMSAFFSAATVFLVALAVIRVSRSRLGAAVGGLALAFSLEFWEQSVIAEVYSLNAFFFAACTLALLLWRDDRTDARLRLFALLYGLSLCNHSIMFMAGPVLFAYILVIEPAAIRRGRLWLSMAGLILLGWSVHLYLPLRSMANPPVDWGNPETLSNFWAVITREQHRFILAQHPRSLSRFIAQSAVYSRIYAWEFTPWVGWIPLIGAVTLHFRRRDACGLLLALFATVSAGSILAPNFDLDPVAIWINTTYWIPAYVVAAMLLGAGFARLSAAAPRRPLAWGLALACVLSPLLVHLHHNNRSEAYLARDYGMNLLRTMEQDAVFVAATDHAIFPVLYLQVVEGRRPDILIGNKYGYLEEALYAGMPREFLDTIRRYPDADQEREILRWFIANTDRPVYFTRWPMVCAPGECVVSNAGLLVRVARAGAPPAPERDLWSEYIWRSLDPADTRSDWSFGVILFEYHYARGRDHLAAGDDATAAQSFETGLAAGGERPYWLNDIASEWTTRGRDDTALEYYRRAVAVAPDYAPAHRNLARLHMRGGRHAVALEHLERVLDQRPGDYAALRLSARCLAALGRAEQALERLERARGVRPEDPSIYDEMSELYGALSDPARAQEMREYARDLREAAKPESRPGPD